MAAMADRGLRQESTRAYGGRVAVGSDERPEGSPCISGVCCARPLLIMLCAFVFLGNMRMPGQKILAFKSRNTVTRAVPCVSTPPHIICIGNGRVNGRSYLSMANTPTPTRSRHPDNNSRLLLTCFSYERFLLSYEWSESGAPNHPIVNANGSRYKLNNHLRWCAAQGALRFPNTRQPIVAGCCRLCSESAIIMIVLLWVVEWSHFRCWIYANGIAVKIENRKSMECIVNFCWPVHIELEFNPEMNSCRSSSVWCHLLADMTVKRDRVQLLRLLARSSIRMGCCLRCERQDLQICKILSH